VTARYRFTDEAEAGFIRIACDVRDRFGLSVSRTVARDLERAFQLIAAQPGIGHRRDDLTSNEHLRFWQQGQTLIAYHRVEFGVEILFVERSERNWGDLLAEQPPSI